PTRIDRGPGKPKAPAATAPRLAPAGPTCKPGCDDRGAPEPACAPKKERPMQTIVRPLLLALSLALPALALADADGAEGKGRCAHCAQGEKKETCGCASGEKAGGCPHCAK